MSENKELKEILSLISDNVCDDTKRYVNIHLSKDDYNKLITFLESIEYYEQRR